MFEFTINGQKLTVRSTIAVSDTINYLTAGFDFSSDWSGLAKWAHFKKSSDTTVYDVKLVDDAITADMALNLPAGVYTVYLHGNAYTDDELTQRITTTSVQIVIQQSGILSGEPIPDIPASAAEQIEAEVESAKAKATEASESGRGSKVR